MVEFKKFFDEYYSDLSNEDILKEIVRLKGMKQSDSTKYLIQKLQQKL